MAPKTNGPDFIKIYFILEIKKKEDTFLYILYQFLALISFTVGVILSIPLVPGPGFVFIILGLLLIQFPYKKRVFRKLLESQRFIKFQDFLLKKLKIKLIV